MAWRRREPAASVLLFSILTVVKACMSLFQQETTHQPAPVNPADLLYLARRYRWLWFSSIVLVGITGVVSSLYPQVPYASPESLGFCVEGMSIATTGAVLAVFRASLLPVPAICWSAVLVAGGMLFSFFSRRGFIVLGALAGIVMIAQMRILPVIHDPQGEVMGLFSTTSCLGMAILPFIATLFADITGFFLHSASPRSLPSWSLSLSYWSVCWISPLSPVCKIPTDSSAIKGNFVMRL